MEKIKPVQLNEVVQRLVARLQPERIYLYGSHAYGQPHEDSDIDLLIVVSEPALAHSQKYRRSLPCPARTFHACRD